MWTLILIPSCFTKTVFVNISFGMVWRTVLDNILYILESILCFDGRYTVPSTEMLSTNFICIECLIFMLLG
jgi:hypothetical protein